MPRVIDPEICISCGVCADACPQEAISEGDDSYVIDPEKCDDCATCEGECPSEAIKAAEE
ncbi:MAG: 4Fe-4S binding protein [Armatimonadetes bacterium]|nr:4Fe-4S binding protein [Armatimonadota bacterium]